jgi:hypothetical protein
MPEPQLFLNVTSKRILVGYQKYYHRWVWWTYSYDRHERQQSKQGQRILHWRKKPLLFKTSKLQEAVWNLNKTGRFLKSFKELQILDETPVDGSPSPTGGVLVSARRAPLVDDPIEYNTEILEMSDGRKLDQTWSAVRYAYERRYQTRRRYMFPRARTRRPPQRPKQVDLYIEVD